MTWQVAQERAINAAARAQRLAEEAALETRAAAERERARGEALEQMREVLQLTSLHLTPAHFTPPHFSGPIAGGPAHARR